MNYNRTGRYHRWISDYRRKMRSYQAEAESKLEKIRKYSDSATYNEDVAKIEEARMEKVKALQKETASEISEILSGMQQSVEKQPIITPTQEQESILRMLKMKDTVSIEELQKAGEALADCPLAASVINELAVKNGHPGYQVKCDHMSRKEALLHIENLKDFASTTCRMDRVDNRSEWLRSQAYDSGSNGRNTKAFVADRDFDDVRSCMGFAGAVGNYDAFSEAVDY